MTKFKTRRDLTLETNYVNWCLLYHAHYAGKAIAFLKSGPEWKYVARQHAWDARWWLEKANNPDLAPGRNVG